MQRLGKYVLCGILEKLCGPHKHRMCGGNMQKSVSYVFYAGVSLADVSCWWHWPVTTTLAWQHYWASRQAVGDSWAEIFLLLLLLPVCLCRWNFMRSPHKLNIDSSKNMKNIKIIKIAVDKYGEYLVWSEVIQQVESVIQPFNVSTASILTLWYDVIIFFVLV